MNNKKMEDFEIEIQKIFSEKLKEIDIADKYFEKIHYNRLIEITDSDAKVIYTSRWRDHRHSQDRIIEFSKQTGLSIRQRDKSNIFLSKDELYAIALKIKELEKLEWHFI